MGKFVQWVFKCVWSELFIMKQDWFLDQVFSTKQFILFFAKATLKAISGENCKVRGSLIKLHTNFWCNFHITAGTRLENQNGPFHVLPQIKRHQYVLQAFPTSVCLILDSSFLVIVVSSPFSFITCEPTLLKFGLFFVVPLGNEMSLAIGPLELFVKVNGDNVLLFFFWSKICSFNQE